MKSLPYGTDMNVIKMDREEIEQLVKERPYVQLSNQKLGPATKSNSYGYMTNLRPDEPSLSSGRQNRTNFANEHKLSRENKGENDYGF